MVVIWALEVEQPGSVWVHRELSCLCMGQDFGKSNDGQAQDCSSLGYGNNLLWIFFVKNSLQLKEYYFLPPCSHFLSIFLSFWSGSFSDSVCIRRGRQALVSLFPRAFLSSVQQQFVHSWPSGSLRDMATTTVKEHPHVSLIPTKFLSLPRSLCWPHGLHHKESSFVLLLVMCGILQLPAVKAIMPQAFLAV